MNNRTYVAIITMGDAGRLPSLARQPGLAPDRGAHEGRWSYEVLGVLEVPHRPHPGYDHVRGHYQVGMNKTTAAARPGGCSHKLVTS